ncbi:MAG: HNH endonuclease [Anaeromyxobacteraceae bacterium]
MDNDPRLLAKRLADLLAREHAALADFLVALADFDRERRWLELGHANLFSFLHRELGLSKGAASYRNAAAALIQRCPEVVAPLRSGKLCLSTVVELSRVLTTENQGEVLPRFLGASKWEAKVIAAELCPAESPQRRAVVTAVVPALRAAVTGPAPAAPLLPEPPAGDATRDGVRPAELRFERPHAPAALAAPVRPAVKPDAADPLTADLSRLHVTVSKRFLAKLAAARDALSHSHPSANIEAILEAGLDLLLAARDRKRGLVKKPRTAPPAPSARPRHVPASVRREVFTRDEGKCQWPLTSGGACGSTTRLELDHIVPIARGGTSTVGNLRIVCAVHNIVAARLALGDRVMDRFTATGRRAASASARCGGRPAHEAPEHSGPEEDGAALSLPFG